MAFKEYLAVLDSDLYEYKGTTKSILARIAHLIIGPPEEGPNGKPLTDPSPDEGLCIATQAYLACQLGVSESTVRAAVQQYAEDGWLIVHKFRDRRGHERNNYSFAPGALATIQARKRQRDEHGEYIRSKQLKMQRAHSSGQFAGRVTRVNEASTTRDARVNAAPPSNLHAGLQADCATTSKQIARQPPGKLPAVVGLVVGLEGGIVSKSQSKTKGASDNTSSASLTDQDQNQTPSTPWDDEEEPAPVNPTPKPRGVAPNPTGTSRPGTRGVDDSCMDAALPRPPAEQPCERGGLHEWREHTHTTDRCSECGMFRTSPAVTQWTEADDLEAEYMEMVECYDPYDTYWSAPEEPTPTAANRAALSASEFARATGAVARWN